VPPQARGGATAASWGSGPCGIRRVNHEGIIATVAGIGAGTGAAGFSGDGEPAIRARLAAPAGVAVDRDGNLYIADTGNNRVRRVGIKD
jgi:DNA-binding beta-propeller fold protein YncE